MTPLGLLAVVTATVLTLVQAIPTISVTGAKFFTSEGKQFFVKGMLIPESQPDRY